MSSWSLYKPNDAAPWNIGRVVHLHRRAAFAATWNEIERDLRDGPDGAVTRLIEGHSRLEGVPEEFESLAEIIGQAAVDSGSAYGSRRGGCTAAYSLPIRSRNA